MLTLESVSKTYRGAARPAVDRLSLEVRDGEVFGFLGPNGAGKTTTIKMVVGLLAPDSGRILVNGCDVSRDPVAAKSRIGFVPDNPEVYDKLTGIEYLNLVADAFRVPTDVRRNRIGELAGAFEIEKALGDLIQSYSHGMKQKLILTAALVHDPDLFILDEPITGLDPKSSHFFKELMRRHCERGRSVFFSTHILEVAERICDRVAIIDKGRLLACGTLESLRARAQAAQVASGERGVAAAAAGAAQEDVASLERIFLDLTGEGEELETATARWESRRQGDEGGARAGRTRRAR